MARKQNRDLWDQWRQHVSGQRASGLSIAAYCQRRGIATATFYAWKRKLQGPPRLRSARQRVTPTSRAGKGDSSPSLRQRPQNVASLSASPRREHDFLQLPIREVRSSPWIELTLIDGTLVRIPQENLTALTTLLCVLRGELPSGSGEARHA